MASPTGQWDFSRMSVLLPESILKRISAIRPPHPLLAKSEKLLTNKERVRRHLTASSCCPICFAAEESVLHVLRDCVVAGNTWRRLVRPCKLVEFMALPFDEWLMRNLHGGGGFAIDVARWGVLFPTICWILWKRRCKQVMDPDSGVVSEPFLVGHQLAAAYAASAAVGAKVGGAQVPVKRWCFWCVELETDNMEVVEILNGTSAALPGNSLVDDLRELLARDWNVVFWHISREQNKVADALAALGCNGPIGVALYEHPPASINKIPVDDSCDMTTTCTGG
ncbi:hypothetical protein V6N12_066417 [Hibiscus sabdariffa]|uniref:RNase H type-1 domain-containing protein n=1 Tax=Hibiscus sabdariffa TaxID=183260 RepID=A0ABR2CQ31_9ROSI